MNGSAINTSSRGPAVLAVTAATFVCCTVFVALRLISRFGIVRKPGADDYFMILAWILAFGTSFAICYGTSVGLGRHETDIPSNWVSPMNKSAYVFSVLYNPALMATKTSILIFYLSLSETQKIFRWATFATLIVVNTGGLALTLLNVLQCRPVSAAWESPVPATASCTNIVTIYLSSAPLNIITDLAILFLPMPILTSMRLPKKQKAILVITFGFGVFVAVVDVVRIAYLQSAARANFSDIQADHAATKGDSRSEDDFSWYISFTLMWSAIEVNLGIMCGCVPALKPLITRFLPNWILDHTAREKSATHTSDTLARGSMAIRPDISSSSAPSRPKSITETPLTKPPSVHGDHEQPMDMMDFLTTPDMNEMPQRHQSHPSTGRTRQQSMAFFDFIETKRKKNITLMNNRESVYPILMVTILFFIWGFAYGLLETLNAGFQAVAQVSSGQTLGQQAAYYLGYMVGPLTFGRLVFRYWGFKACYTVGLGLYACGTLVFWPAAVLTSFPAFLISNFITGLGLSTLELSANPFIALCGPPEYAEIRLNISQAIQAIGSILSPLLANKVLVKASAGSLINLQWTYLGISFFTIILAVVYYYIPLPEATDDELEEASARLPIPRQATIGSSKIKLVSVTLALGVFSQFCYVGGQEGVSTAFPAYLRRVMPSADTVNFFAIGHTAFATSRFAAAIMNIWINPRYVLLFFYLGAIAFAAACMNGSGATPTALIIMVMFFEGPIFPMIYVQPLRGMGKHTKDAAVLLTAATAGGGALPPIVYAVMKAHNIQYAFCVIVAAFAAGTLFPLWLSLYPTARRISDPVRDEQARRESMVDRERRMAQAPRANKKTRFLQRLGLRKRTGGTVHVLPTSEHGEHDSSAGLRGPLDVHNHSNGISPGAERVPAFKGNRSSAGSSSINFETTPTWLSSGGGGHANGRANGHANGGPRHPSVGQQPNPSPDFQKTRPAWMDPDEGNAGPSRT